MQFNFVSTAFISDIITLALKEDVSCIELFICAQEQGF